MALRLTLAVPEKPLVQDEEAAWVLAPAAKGCVQILPGHAEYTATLSVGELRFAQGDSVRRFALAGGFLEVKNGAVTVLADEVAACESISREEAERELEAGREALRAARTTKEVDAALARERKASAWLEAAKEE